MRNLIDISYTIFISHASEDKEAIIEPIVKALEKGGITYWYDKNEIKWGDSISSKINEGLENAKYGIVVLSENFINKGWTKAELNSLLNIEFSNGQKKVLPLIVGDEENILSKLPLLRDKKYLVWNGNPFLVVNELKNILGKTSKEPLNNEIFSIPMPKKVKKITQLDKDRFVKQIYQGIVEYFENALVSLENKYNEIETEMEKINSFKFIAKAYVEGELKSKCKIWISDSLGNSIAYSSSYFSIEDDSSFNDWLFLEEDEDGLYMKASGLNFFIDESKKIKSGKEAGEYFWKFFIQYLES